MVANGDRVLKHKSAYFVASHDALMKSVSESVSNLSLGVAEMVVKERRAKTKRDAMKHVKGCIFFCGCGFFVQCVCVCVEL